MGMKGMKALRLLPILGIGAALGCLQDVPGLSPDGTRLAFLTEGVQVARLLEFSTGKVLDLPLPAEERAEGVLWVGSDLLILAGREGAESAQSLWRADQAGGNAVRLDVQFFGTRPPFSGRYRGAPCLYVPNPTNAATSVRKPPDYLATASLPFLGMSAGGDWVAHVEYEPRGELGPGGLAAVHLMDTRSGSEVRLPASEIRRACHRDARPPVCARVSPDGTRALLGFEAETLFRGASSEYTFGVFDLQARTLLWKGVSNALRGLPLFKAGSVYALEAVERPKDVGDRGVGALGGPSGRRSQAVGRLVLVRHAAEQRRILLELDLGEGSQATRYSASPDEERFVLQVEGKRPRLLLIPVRDDVRKDEVRELPVR